MKTEAQFNKYAAYYDFFYQNKDYVKEVDFIEKIFTNFAQTSTRKILSLGAGTCSHELLLEKRGYKVSGIDASSEMVKIAKEKIEKAGSDITIQQSEISSLGRLESFDAVISLFNVAGYQNTDEELDAFFSTCSKNLTPGGICVFDAWYTPAVILNRPEDRTAYATNEGGDTIVRETNQELDINNSVLKITFTLYRGKEKRELLTKEDHYMRFFTLKELSYAAYKNDMKIERALSPFSLSRDASEDEWNMWVILRKNK